VLQCGRDFGYCHWHNHSEYTMALGSTQPLTEMYARGIFPWWGFGDKGGRYVRLTVLLPSCANCLEIVLALKVTQLSPHSRLFFQLLLAQIVKQFANSRKKRNAHFQAQVGRCHCSTHTGSLIQSSTSRPLI